MERSSGILMPMSSLPSPYGIGTLGKAAYDFIDFLAAAGQSCWQLLPMSPPGMGNSPYSSYSTFAGEIMYIDPELLVRDGLLLPGETEEYDWGSDPRRVDYDRVRQGRDALLRRAFQRGFWLIKGKVTLFRRDNPWVDQYALYMALKKHFDQKSWIDWPEDISYHRPEAVKEYSDLLRDEVDFYAFTQYLFYSQWNALRAYAREKGISFIGDLPIYVALDSADVWSEPQFFMLDEKNNPVEVAGVPPDAFSEDGQLWGNPIYNYDAMRADGFGWWIRRMEGAGRLYDTVRIDHFRGMESYWAVKYGESTARSGVWRKGPGMDLVGVLLSWFRDMHFIAEDLGVITDGVRQLLQDSGLPGMKVLQFGFDVNGESDYMPHRCEENSVCYIGTHDNETVKGWLETTPEENISYARKYMHITPDEGWCWGMIRAGMGCPAKLFVMQMQDVLELGRECRTNTPGTLEGNWEWRMLPGETTEALREKLLDYTKTYRRTKI